MRISTYFYFIYHTLTHTQASSHAHLLTHAYINNQSLDCYRYCSLFCSFISTCMRVYTAYLTECKNIWIRKNDRDKGRIESEPKEVREDGRMRRRKKRRKISKASYTYITLFLKKAILWIFRLKFLSFFFSLRYSLLRIFFFTLPKKCYTVGIVIWCGGGVVWCGMVLAWSKNQCSHTNCFVLSWTIWLCVLFPLPPRLLHFILFVRTHKAEVFFLLLRFFLLEIIRYVFWLWTNDGQFRHCCFRYPFYVTTQFQKKAEKCIYVVYVKQRTLTKVCMG